jgi:hypothetical protein
MEHPEAAVCERAWWSVIALQMHTYMRRAPLDIENDYQFKRCPTIPGCLFFKLASNLQDFFLLRGSDN